VTPAKRKLTLKERRRRARIIGLVFFLILAGTLLVGLVMGLRRPEVTIATVTVLGTNYVRSDLVERVVHDALGGYYLFVIPRSNTFLFPKDEIIRELKEVFHPVDRVVIERNELTGISVFVTEYVPDALWCTGFEEGSSCYFMNESGFVFTPTQEKANGLLRFSSGRDSVTVGERYLDGEYERLRAFVENLTVATSRTPERISINEHNDVSVSFVEGGEVRFTLENTDDTLLDNIASVFASRRFQSDELFEYADFRFGNKIYVKFQGE